MPNQAYSWIPFVPYIALPAQPLTTPVKPVAHQGRVLTRRKYRNWFLTHNYGLQALWRERVLAYQVAASVAAPTTREAFGIDAIDQALREVGAAATLTPL